MVTEFNITVIDESHFSQIRESMKKQYEIKLDDMLVVEGCLNDDKTVLGGREAFLSHFCTFFNFNICFSHSEGKYVRKLDKKMSDEEFINKKIEGLIEKLDNAYL